MTNDQKVEKLRGLMREAAATNGRLRQLEIDVAMGGVPASFEEKERYRAERARVLEIHEEASGILREAAVHVWNLISVQRTMFFYEHMQLNEGEIPF